MALLLLAASPSPQVVSISPDDPVIQYTGRWDFSNPQEPWCAWQGSSFVVQFDGTDLAAVLNVGSSTEWFRVIVDGDHSASFKLRITPGRQVVPLATDLPSGVHQVEVVRETYFGTNATLFGLHLEGTSFLPPPPRRPHRMVFYGDSNLAGYSNESERNLGDQDLVGVHFGFAGILARSLNAEYHNISSSGETLGGLLNRYDRMQWYGENPQWDFQSFPADVVVVNIGANDVSWRGVPAITADYNRLLDDLRVAHPNAHIVLSNGVGWSFDEPANFTTQIVASRADPNLSVCNFPWVFERFHGCQTDQAGMADYLAQHLGPIMGWTVQDLDVVSGFGRNGGVANGSFEDLAPFGGFAWRYFDDPGVRRVVSPAKAKDGEAFVCLSAGAEIHQPNPAKDGDTIEVSLWMRGQGSATVTVDFRDQALYSAAMTSDQRNVQLNPQWTEVRMRVPAPPTPRPIFHTRLTIAANGSSVACVDKIRQRTR